MDFSAGVSISAFAVFLQGLLSFFSPCVLPLVPLYISYLAGGAKTEIDGQIRYKRGKVMLHTLFFVLGISFAFFALGLGFTAIGSFLSEQRTLFARISGIIMILFGLLQMGLFESKMLSKEFRLPFRLDKITMNPGVALLLGFTFSFAWTPCVGPALTSVLLLASSAKSSMLGWLLIGMYTLGFVLPFLATGLFTGSLLDFFKKHQKAVKYTVKAGGLLLILFGIMTFTGWMNQITGYLSRISLPAAASSSSSVSEPANSAQVPSSSNPPQASGATASSSEPKILPAPDFTLVDQFGTSHTLSDYKGKVVFVNFWATWCPPCRQEMPDIQAVFEEHGSNEDDLVILGVIVPSGGETADDIAAFMEENGYTYPALIDTTGQVSGTYGISAVPTTFVVDKEGNVLGYVPGMMTREMLDSVISQSLGE